MNKWHSVLRDVLDVYGTICDFLSPQKNTCTFFQNMLISFHHAIRLKVNFRYMSSISEEQPCHCLPK